MFLIARFLETSKYSRTFAVLREELEELQPTEPGSEADFVLPPRKDYMGNSHVATYTELSEAHPEVTPEYLPLLMERLKGLTGQPTLGGLAMPKRAYLEWQKENEPVIRLLQRDMVETRIDPLRPWALLYGHFERLASVRGHLVASYNGIFDRTGQIFFTGADDSLVKVWCAKTGRCMRTLRGHSSLQAENTEGVVILDLTINEENTLLASAASDMTVMIWSTQTWEPLTILKIDKEIKSVAFSPSVHADSNCFLVGCRDGRTRVYKWDAEISNYDKKPIVLETFDKRTDSVNTTAFNRTGSRFVVGGTDGLVYLFQIVPRGPDIAGSSQEPGMSCKLMRRFDASSLGWRKEDHTPRRSVGRDISIKELRFSKSGNRFASGCVDGTVNVYEYVPKDDTWDTTKRKSRSSGQILQNSANLKLAVDLPVIEDEIAARVANAIFAEPVLSHAIEEGPVLMEIGTSAGIVTPAESAAEAVDGVTAVCWAADDCRIAAVLSDFIIRVCDPTSGGMLCTLQGHTKAVYHLDAHPTDPNVLLSGSYDGQIILWDIARGSKLRNIAFGDPLLGASFNVEGDLIGVVDMSGQAHFVGIAAEPYGMPFEQFHGCDFDAVSINANGDLWDPQNNSLPHEVPFLVLMDGRGIPHDGDYAKVRESFALDRSLATNTDAIVAEREIKKAIESVEASLLTREKAQEWSKKEKQERRRARPLMVQLDEPQMTNYEDVPIVPLPESSGEEFAGDGGADDEDDDEEEVAAVDSEISDGDFIDDGPLNHPPRMKAVTKRKRNRAMHSSDDEGDWIEEPTSSRRGGKARTSYAEVLEDSESASDSSLRKPKGRKSASLSHKGKGKLEGFVAPITAPSPWVTSCKHSPSGAPYVPQLGDLVAYFPAGHRAWLEQARETAHNTAEVNVACREDVIFGVVDKIDYVVHQPACCIMQLHVHEEDGSCTPGGVPHEDEMVPVMKVTRKELLEIKWWDQDQAADFIVLFQSYVKGMEEQWKVGDQVFVQYDGDAMWEGEIESIIQPNVQPWNSITVRFTPTDDAPIGSCETFSPWELKRSDTHHGFIEAYRGLDEPLVSMMTRWSKKPALAPFVAAIDFAAYPEYLQLIAYPVWLDLIKERAKNGFYRRAEAVGWDVMQMRKNALMFNEENSDVYETAQNKLPKLLEEVMAGALPGNHRRWDLPHHDHPLSPPVKKGPKIKLLVKSKHASRAGKRRRNILSSDTESDQEIGAQTGYDDDQIQDSDPWDSDVPEKLMSGKSVSPSRKEFSHSEEEDTILQAVLPSVPTRLDSDVDAPGESDEDYVETRQPSPRVVARPWFEPQPLAEPFFSSRRVSLSDGSKYCKRKRPQEDEHADLYTDDEQGTASDGGSDSIDSDESVTVRKRPSVPAASENKLKRTRSGSDDEEYADGDDAGGSSSVSPKRKRLRHRQTVDLPPDNARVYPVPLPESYVPSVPALPGSARKLVAGTRKKIRRSPRFVESSESE
ncbi:Bromodomain and WD repeat-containing protein 3 [Thoreauomyces humboldtii]|nr:Bromodomain and WD repeat-containing protein 3 [Thoreauomyces humboldtii]